MLPYAAAIRRHAAALLPLSRRLPRTLRLIIDYFAPFSFAAYAIRRAAAMLLRRIASARLYAACFAMLLLMPLMSAAMSAPRHARPAFSHSATILPFFFFFAVTRV